MTRLDDRAMKDLTALAVERCGRALADVLQLVDDHEQTSIIAATVASIVLGFSADHLQRHRKVQGSAAFVDALQAVSGFAKSSAAESKLGSASR